MRDQRSSERTEEDSVGQDKSGHMQHASTWTPTTVSLKSFRSENNYPATNVIVLQIAYSTLNPQHEKGAARVIGLTQVPRRRCLGAGAHALPQQASNKRFNDFFIYSSMITIIIINIVRITPRIIPSS